MKNQIIIFDGVCNVCNAFVQFIIRHDGKKKFRFTSLESETAKEIIADRKIPPHNNETVIFVSDEKILTHSSAVLYIAKELGGVWKLFFVFIIIPKFFRDFFYAIFSKYRYKVFGKRDSCMIPNEDVQSRFI